MSEQRSRDSGGRVVDVQRVSVTQRLACMSALHPWRVLAVWGLVLVASFGAIAVFLGSALNSDATITSHPDSVRASDLLAENFSQRNHVDEAIVIRSAQLTTSDPAFRTFVEGVRSSLADTGATQTVGDPYAVGAAGAISEDGHAVAVTVMLGDDPENGIVEVIDKVEASDTDPGFDVAITGTYTLDRDFNELSASDLQKGELQFGLPAALIVLLLVFGAVVAAVIPMSVAIISIIVAVASVGADRAGHLAVVLYRQHDHRDGSGARYRLQPVRAVALSRATRSRVKTR